MTVNPISTEPGPEATANGSSRGPVLLAVGDGMPHRHPGVLVLGAWLRQRRLALRLSAGEVARTLGAGLTGGRLERMESGHAPLAVRTALALARAVGITDEAGLATVEDLAEQSGPSFADGRPGTRERLCGMEAVAEEIVAVALGPLWPAQWEWDPPVPVRAEPRPWPAALTTLVLQDRLLDQPLGCHALTARRLTALADRAESACLDLRVAPFLAAEAIHLAGALGALCSRIALPGGRTLYVAEGYDPVYRAPGSKTRTAMNDLLTATVGGRDAVAALRTAARQHSTSRCELSGAGIPVVGCACPPAPDGAPASRKETTVVAVVRRGDAVLLTRGPGGRLGLPSAQVGDRQTISQAAARAVWDQAGYAAVVTHHLDTPAAGAARHVLCAVPGPQPQHDPGARWAPAGTVPGLPPLPHVSATPDESGAHGA